MKLKKLIASALCTAMVFSFAGCGNMGMAATAEAEMVAARKKRT